MIRKPLILKLSFTLFLTAFVLLAVILILLPSSSSAEGSRSGNGGTTDYVYANAQGNFTGRFESPHRRIQDAVDAAGEGDIIEVWEGSYGGFSVDKALTITGNETENATTAWIEIAANNVSISHLNIEKGSGYYQKPEASTGVFFSAPVENITIRECTFMNCSRGLRSTSHAKSRITACVFDNCHRGIVLSSNGCWENTIENCSFTNASTGITIFDARNTHISNCSFENNNRGIYDWGKDTHLKNNHFTNNRDNIFQREEDPYAWFFDPFEEYLALIYAATFIVIITRFVLYRRQKRNRVDAPPAKERKIEKHKK